MGISALATAPLAGYLIDRFSGLHGWQLVWLLTFVVGALSTWAYAAIPEPAPHPRIVEMRRDPGQPGFVRDVLSDRNFVRYLVSVAIWNVALMAAGPFFNVYLVENLHASTAMVGFINAIISLTGLVGVVYFGRMMDRRGTKWVMVVSGLLIPLLPAAWLLVTGAMAGDLHQPLRRRRLGRLHARADEHGDGDGAAREARALRRGVSDGDVRRRVRRPAPRRLHDRRHRL